MPSYSINIVRQTYMLLQLERLKKDYTAREIGGFTAITFTQLELELLTGHPTEIADTLEVLSEDKGRIHLNVADKKRKHESETHHLRVSKANIQGVLHLLDDVMKFTNKS